MGKFEVSVNYDLEKIKASKNVNESINLTDERIVEIHDMIMEDKRQAIKKAKEADPNAKSLSINTFALFIERYESGDLSQADLFALCYAGYVASVTGEKMKVRGIRQGWKAHHLYQIGSSMIKEFIVSNIRQAIGTICGEEWDPDGDFSSNLDNLDLLSGSLKEAEEPNRKPTKTEEKWGYKY